MTLDETATLASYLRSQRTQSQNDVDHIAALHDADDITPEERASFDTGSLHKVDS